MNKHVLSSFFNMSSDVVVSSSLSFTAQTSQKKSNNVSFIKGIAVAMSFFMSSIIGIISYISIIIINAIINIISIINKTKYCSMA